MLNPALAMLRVGVIASACSCWMIGNYLLGGASSSRKNSRQSAHLKLLLCALAQRNCKMDKIALDTRYLRVVKARTPPSVPAGEDCDVSGQWCAYCIKP